MRNLFLKSVLLALLVAGCAAGAHAQGQPTPAPTPAPTPSGQGDFALSESFESLMVAASEFVPTFVREVEKPLGGYFEFIASWLAWLVFMVAFVMVLRQYSDDPIEIVWLCVRAAMIFALLGYNSDTNGDGIRGDLINNFGAAGNTIAYGRLNDEGSTSYLQRLVTQQQKTFNRNYQEFVNNAFTVQVNNGDVPVQYPTNGSPYQRLAVLYSGGDSLDAVNKAFNPSGWDMANLFQWLNFARGIVEFGDLFLLVLQGFLVATMRLAAPFMIVIAINREWARRVSYNYAWAVVVVTFVLPIFSQIIRFFAYLAGNLAMDAQNSQPYYAWDPTTLKIVAQSNPVYMIMVGAAVMTIAGLCMIGSPWLSFMLARGNVVEAVGGMVTSWTGAGVGTAVSAYSAAAGAAVTKMAAETQIQGNTSASGVETRAALAAGNTEARHRAAAETTQARGAYAAGNTEARHRAAAEGIRSRSQAAAESDNAVIGATAQNERAGAEMVKTERDVMAGLGETSVVQAGKVAGAKETARLGLDRAPYDTAKEAPVIGQIIGGGAQYVADFGKGVLGVSYSPRTVFSPNPPPFEGGVSRGGHWGAHRSYGGHTGTDLPWREGESVGSAAPGRVAFAGDTGDGYGKRVVIDHGNGYGTSYSHLSQIPEGIKAGAVVGEGQTVGAVGRSGGDYGAHLHYEVGKMNAGGTEIAAGGKVNPETTNLRPVRGGGGAPPPQLEWTHGLDSETYARRAALTPLVVAQMERDSVMAGATYRANETVAAGREHHASMTAINTTEAQQHSGVAWRAYGERAQAISTELRGSFQGNQIRYNAGVSAAQTGLRGSLQGNQIRHDAGMQGITIRHDSAMAQARMQAVGTTMQAVGANVASQLQSVFQQFNRY